MNRRQLSSIETTDTSSEHDMPELSDLAATLKLNAEDLEMQAQPGTDADALAPLKRLVAAAEDVGKSWSGSWLGYHALVYYEGLQPPPAGARFTIEWGLMDDHLGRLGAHGDWREFDADVVKREIKARAGNPDLAEVKQHAEGAGVTFTNAKAEVLSVLAVVHSTHDDAVLQGHLEEVKQIQILSEAVILKALRPSGQIVSRDHAAMGQGLRVPPHYEVIAEGASIQTTFGACMKLAALARQLANHLRRIAGTKVNILGGTMSLRDMLKNTVVLVKKSGERVEGIQASVQSNKIFTFDANLDVVEGDFVERKLPSGRIERYIVEDPGFISGHSGVSDSYQMTVRREVASRQPTSSPTNLLQEEVAEQMTETEPDPKRVFVVHGRNKTIRDSMFAFLRAVGLDPIEWSVAASATQEGSPYVGVILDQAFKDAQAFVVLLTPDEEVRLREELKDINDRQNVKSEFQPRPNVLFEAGMAMGIAPKRTIFVEIGASRSFSDIVGRHILRLDGTPERRQELVQRLKTAGCAITTSGTDWLSVGTFDIVKEATAPNIEAQPIPQQIDKADALNKLESWFKLLSKEERNREVDFLLVDSGLNFPSGTTKSHIHNLAAAVGYKVKRIGDTTAFLEKKHHIIGIPPRGRKYPGPGG